MKLLPLSLTALLLAGTAAAALSFDQDSETPVQEEAPAERQDAKQDEKAPEDAPEEAPAEEAAEEDAEPERVDRVRPPVVRVAPKRGAALVHAHGARCLTHEGAEVRRGAKYLLRTDVAYA